MKAKKVFFSVLAVVALGVALPQAYYTGFHHGYAQGSNDERLCWTVDPMTFESLKQRVVTARRDIRSYPLLKSRQIKVAMNESTKVNSIPVSFSSPGP